VKAAEGLPSRLPCPGRAEHRGRRQGARRPACRRLACRRWDLLRTRAPAPAAARPNLRLGLAPRMGLKVASVTSVVGWLQRGVRRAADDGAAGAGIGSPRAAAGRGGGRRRRGRAPKPAPPQPPPPAGPERQCGMGRARAGAPQEWRPGMGRPGRGAAPGAGSSGAPVPGEVRRSGSCLRARRVSNGRACGAARGRRRFEGAAGRPPARGVGAGGNGVSQARRGCAGRVCARQGARGQGDFSERGCAAKCAAGLGRKAAGAAPPRGCESDFAAPRVLLRARRRRRPQGCLARGRWEGWFASGVHAVPRVGNRRALGPGAARGPGPGAGPAWKMGMVAACVRARKMGCGRGKDRHRRAGRGSGGRRLGGSRAPRTARGPGVGRRLLGVARRATGGGDGVIEGAPRRAGPGRPGGSTEARGRRRRSRRAPARAAGARARARVGPGPRRCLACIAGKTRGGWRRSEGAQRRGLCVVSSGRGCVGVECTRWRERRA
jgi:hypothetical protein